MRNPTKSEIAAVRGMQHGDLSPLAILLAERNSSMHTMVQWALWKLISGSVEETDHRLEVRRHPDLRNGQSHAEFQAQQVEEQDTAMKLILNGYLSRGMTESAIAAVNAATGRTRGTIANHWRRQKDFIHMCIVMEIIKTDDLPGEVEWGRFDKSK